MTEVRLPQWGMGMRSGTIVEWVKNVGERVEEGELLAIVETEKVETELSSPASGVLTAIHVAEEDTVPVGTVLATIES
jgi:pyruvate/2-oxoglutarate dehydrogenase complex dihydrolipoamide acyltransferase (E2) component